MLKSKKLILSKNNDGKTTIIVGLLKLPWWILLMMSLLALSSTLIINAYLMQVNNQALARFNHNLFYPSKIISFFFLLLSASVLWKKLSRRNLFYNQNSMKDLQSITWENFEVLVGETFRRMGYKIKERGGAKADGGVDLEAWAGNKKVIIQCKHWKKTSVGVNIVREMYGVCMHENASVVYIVTCGFFTKDAKAFASGKPVYLVNGYQLLKWIDNIKKS